MHPARPLLRRALRALLLCLLGAAVCAAGQAVPAGGSGTAVPVFLDVTAQSGLDFVHENGATGDRLLPEVIGAGGALFDYDNDGDLDVYAVQGGTLAPAGRGSPAHLIDRLYRNDLGPDGPRFTDVTEASGIRAAEYGMGAATGDFDNDGWIDLYVTNLGPNRLFRNNGDGTFSDVTTASGTGDPRWSASATFFDYDLDGWLDLFVTNYVAFSIELTRACFSRGSRPDYCTPDVYDAAPDRLFHNNGDGTFSDVSSASGIASASGRGLGVLAADLNDDGWTDVYVANDGDPNHLWINDRGVRFHDEGLLAGVAFNRTGQAEGGMGIGAEDVDGDGDLDLFVTNLDNESNTLYVNAGGGLFDDRTIETGLLGPSFGLTGFGTGFLDYDADGWPDLVVANGAVRMLERLVRQGDAYPLRQHNQLFHNEAGRRFLDVTADAGAAFQTLDVSRGLAVGDLDNDGRTDLVVFNNSGPVRVLLNGSGRANHWVGARILDATGRRDALQASVELMAPGGRSRRHDVRTGGSYCVANDPRLRFALGSDDSPQTIRVRWPDGHVERFTDLAVDRYWELAPGTGRAGDEP